MCEQCLVNPLYWYNVIPGYTLIRAQRDGSFMKAGQWGLVECNDPTYVWDDEPWPHPTFGMTDDEEDAYWRATPGGRYAPSSYEEQIEAFQDDISRFAEGEGAPATPEMGHKLVEACIKAGWTRERHDRIAEWLWSHLGIIVQIVKPTEEGDPFPHLDTISDTAYGWTPLSREGKQGP